jgi:hypothetical protein
MVDVTLLWYTDDTEVSIESRFITCNEKFEVTIRILIIVLLTCLCDVVAC